MKSSKAVQNFRGKNPVDFVYDPTSKRFAMGNNPHGHDGIRWFNGKRIPESDTLVGGRIRFKDGKLVTDEWSGHYGGNWTPEIRQNFIDFMKNNGVDITHGPWGG